MVIALYGKRFSPEYGPGVSKLVDSLIRRGIRVVVYERFYPFLSQSVALPSTVQTFQTFKDIGHVDYLLSIGGDGTLLDTAKHVRDSKTPVLGINTGRLGFLSNVDLNEVDTAIELLVNGTYTLDPRSLIEVKTNGVALSDFPFALNEVSILNKDRSSMISIHAQINDNFMCTYWADGLIVATPTGSTAYSLSCGGPIVTPDSNNLILNPIAPHNLNVRPLVISHTNKVSLRVEGRSDHFLLTLDSRSFEIDSSTLIELTRAPFEMNLIHLEGQNFFQTIRNKLGWGMDKRN
jgi:NAD+ kinase